eukprot:TRINITY_DN4398_c0_g1_i2.p1 TRINITY_DN4398_c0_g1~~TRINITY_DN4398_c0_g1_i2.p1  ORF type:complete len:259 (-),score=49.61 TRINITY_DN4398_c0_g1_i2:2-778(-)
MDTEVAHRDEKEGEFSKDYSVEITGGVDSEVHSTTESPNESTMGAGHNIFNNQQLIRQLSDEMTKEQDVVLDGREQESSVDATINSSENRKSQSPKKKKQNLHPHRQATVVIVAVVVIQDGKVLMVQEAKESCRGKWYIPAGKLEAGEHPLEAAIRECKEETGLNLEPAGVFGIEYKSSVVKNPKNCWVRYGITGKIVGGKLKTQEEEDKESIQAQWMSFEELKTVEVSRRFHLWCALPSIPLSFSLVTILPPGPIDF